MTFEQYKKYLGQFSVSEGLKFDDAIFLFQKEKIPRALASLGICRDKVVIVPRRITNRWGVVLPVVAVWGDVFTGNEEVTDVVLPPTVSAIGKGCFAGCKNLERIVIPKAVDSIGEGTFAGCDKLTDVYYEGTYEEWKEVRLHTERRDVDFGAAIPSTPVLEIRGDRLVHIPGNDALLTCNIHFRCVLDEKDCGVDNSFHYSVKVL